MKSKYRWILGRSFDALRDFLPPLGKEVSGVCREVGSSADHGPKFPGLGEGGDSGGFGSYVWRKGATPEAQQTSM